MCLMEVSQYSARVILRKVPAGGGQALLRRSDW